MKKFIVFCLITLFPYVAVYGDWTGGVWWFESEDECTTNCIDNCRTWAGTDEGYACPVGWYYNYDSTSHSVQCLRGADDYYTGHIVQIEDYGDEGGFYRETTAIRYDDTDCGPALQKVDLEDGKTRFFCEGLKWEDRWPDYTGYRGCNRYIITTEVVKCKSGYYYDSEVEDCLLCGTTTISGVTYNLTSDENKSSRNYACYVSGEYDDERGKYTLKYPSGDKCLYNMLTNP